jgi:hypothetical protein
MAAILPFTAVFNFAGKFHVFGPKPDGPFNTFGPEVAHRQHRISPSVRNSISLTDPNIRKPSRWENEWQIPFSRQE